MAAPRQTASQTYVSTRDGTATGQNFEAAVLQGLAPDGGLYLPTEIPIASDWKDWIDLPYHELAVRLLSLFISSDEIPTEDLKELTKRSYSTFRAKEITPVKHLRDNLYLLELFHGPSLSFKDCALQFLGNLFEYFLVRRNQGKEGKERYHLTIVGATSGDTGSAAILGLRSKKDISVFILHPNGRISPFQRAQMTTVPDENVHNIALEGFFDDCQNIVKVLFGDPEINKTLHLGAVNSINTARILGQITYYFHAYFQLVKNSGLKLGEKVRFVVPSGNFGNVLAGYFAYKMGLPIEKLVVATNENDILDRFWRTGTYAKQAEANGDAEACKETLSPAMDILVSSNFERLMYLLAKDAAAAAGADEASSRKQAASDVVSWYSSLKSQGSFGPVPNNMMENGRQVFESERVSDSQTLETMKTYYESIKYILDPHTSVGVAASDRSIARTDEKLIHVSLSTAHPAKFSAAVEKALHDQKDFDFKSSVLPPEFADLLLRPERVTIAKNSWEEVGEIIKKQVEEELKGSA